ncbi:Xylulose kinase [uncultured Pleomorphomonas sp.]|uniref:Xylulose kinase n=1 Tax=uncultured Pleomorphomonas sp. TaxID=442121 RepID=A0A212LFZ4_9HYPH|nr:FGGY family carbohydrate kinase [uncultured Pleomorphomonas sp.]SCM76387.1 Xylulose kinase [uncultured Pleomorphomonas sp.]
MSLLGIDVGTTGCKAVVFDAAGRPLAQARREYPLANPREGFWELDPEQVWQQVLAAIRETTATAGAGVTALAVSALGEAVLPVDRDGLPLAGGAISADLRAAAEIDLLRARLGAAAIYAITGQPATAYYSLPKVMWWRRNTPDIYARTHKFVCFGDYVLMRLGLEPAIDATMAARTLAYDINRGAWSETMIEAAGIDPAKLPAVVASGSSIGRLGRRGAALTGLPADVEVVAGGFDQACAALAAGVVTEGTGFYGLGTTEALALAMRHPNPALSKLNVAVIPHAVPGILLAMTGSQTGGRLLRWCRDELCADERLAAAARNVDAYDLMLAGLTPEPGPLMVLPHFAGSGSLDGDADALGAILGLSFDARRADIVKAVLEGVTYEQALSLARLGAEGVSPTRFAVVGGGARSDLWMQIKADIIGRPLARQQIFDASCLGAALLAGIATGVYASPQAAVNAVERPVSLFEPNERRHALHQRRLAAYGTLHAGLAEVNAALRTTAVN